MPGKYIFPVIFAKIVAVVQFLSSFLISRFSKLSNLKEKILFSFFVISAIHWIILGLVQFAYFNFGLTPAFLLWKWGQILVYFQYILASALIFILADLQNKTLNKILFIFLFCFLLFLIFDLNKLVEFKGATEYKALFRYSVNVNLIFALWVFSLIPLIGYLIVREVKKEKFPTREFFFLAVIMYYGTLAAFEVFDVFEGFEGSPILVGRSVLYFLIPYSLYLAFKYY